MGTVDGASLNRAKRSLLIGWYILSTPSIMANTIPDFDRAWAACAERWLQAFRE